MTKAEKNYLDRVTRRLAIAGLFRMSGGLEGELMLLLKS